MPFTATRAPPHGLSLFSCSSSSRALSLLPESVLVRYGNCHSVVGDRRLRLIALPSRPLPAASHAIGTSSSIVSKTSSPSFMGESGLLIVGPGVLGKLVAEKWLKDYPGSHIFGQTMTTEHHDELVKLGIKPSLKGKSDGEYSNIIFCAPPSRTADYPADVRLAISNWSGKGSFLFTSSTAVYDCNDEALCDEDYPVVPLGRSPRTDVLLKAENAVLDAGGCVLRLAGLYNADRGAHFYYLKKGTVDIHPDGILNLIHYEDAASLAIAIMKKKLRSRIFLGCDNDPMSRGELMDCVNQSGKFSERFQGFTGNSDKQTKRTNNSKTRAEIGWEPKYSRFSDFLQHVT
ncbi:uncharacterized protein LOC110027634 isoform X2 [Phalaenopsis equestris]|uniref:uncharacterized protein LOC110027634 isoform X2 n=1 Tax=Phalaenopsis equestris TaxID=78828 RepID=UPI0009E3EDD3|nr:uncharacterized protein LOC110027634 isoform X2 [Phalaenopsis equestris]